MENKKSIIIISVVILLLVAVGVVVYSMRHTNNPQTNTQTPPPEVTTKKVPDEKLFENPPAVPVVETITENAAASPQLTQKQAETLVADTWGECTKDSCAGPVTVTLEYVKGWNIIHAVYNNLLDDTTLAQKIEAKVLYQDKKWALDEPTISWSCRPNHGHQDFSTVNCK